MSDMLIVGAAGMFSPLYALFVEDFIVGGNEIVIGISMSIYLVSRSVLQIPIATLIDKIKGERDDYNFMVIFSIAGGLLNLGLLAISSIWQLYLINMLMGVFTAITYPSYMALFTRHIDKNMEGTEWGVYYTFTDLSTAALAGVGGYLASAFGFRNLILIVSALSVIGGFLLIPVKSYIYKRTFGFSILKD